MCKGSSLSASGLSLLCASSEWCLLRATCATNFPLLSKTAGNVTKWMTFPFSVWVSKSKEQRNNYDSAAGDGQCLQHVSNAIINEINSRATRTFIIKSLNDYLHKFNLPSLFPSMLLSNPASFTRATKTPIENILVLSVAIYKKRGDTFIQLYFYEYCLVVKHYTNLYTVFKTAPQPYLLPSKMQ